MAQRTTSLGPKPSLFSFCFFWGFCFSSLRSFLCFLIDKKTSFPHKKGHFLFIFQCLPLFLFSIFGASPLSSLSLSLSLSCSFLSSFLPVFHFLFLVLAFSFLLCLLFLFQDVLLFLLFCLLSCVVLNHNISFIFALHLVFWLLFFCFSCFHILLFFDFWKPVKKHL